jgi:hypothetical protein
VSVIRQAPLGCPLEVDVGEARVLLDNLAKARLGGRVITRVKMFAPEREETSNCLIHPVPP